jgi:hypothetical protein
VDAVCYQPQGTLHRGSIAVSRPFAGSAARTGGTSVKPRIPVFVASFALLALATGASVQAQSAAPVDPPHPAHIHVGQCPQPGDVAFPLNDVVLPADESVGLADSAIPAEVSSTVVEVALTDIVGGDHAINVHQSAEAMDVYIACGDIGGTMLGTADIAIGLAEQNGSGHHGVAWLHDNGDGTTRVDVVLLTTGGMGAPGASMAPAASMSPAESMAPAGSMAPSESIAPDGSPSS